jgi:hypothetical protein
MHKTPSGAGNRRKFTISAWVKRGSNLGANSYIFDARVDGSDNAPFQFNTSDQIFFRTKVGGTSYFIQTNRVFRDVSAWYHLVIVYDNTLGTAGDRIQLWVNGVRETSFADSTMPNQNTDTTVNNASVVQTVGSEGGGASFFDGYISEFVLLDGTADSPVDTLGEFDEDSGIWKPINVSGLTFGTNGFYLDFEDSANLGNDANGGTDLTEVNLAATDQSTDTCTNNFATFNPLIRNKSYNDGSLAEGNTYFAPDGRAIACSSIGVTSGKWYAEFKATDAGALSIGVGDIQLGIQAIGQTNPIYYDNNPSYAIGYYNSNGNLSYNGTSASYGNSYTDNNIIGVALDMDNYAVYFSKNGTFQNSGDPTSGASKTGDATSTASYNPLNSGEPMFLFVEDFSASGVGQCYVNFGSPAFAISSGNADADGHGNFEYAVPSGYFALNTKNLAEYG